MDSWAVVADSPVPAPDAATDPGCNALVKPRSHSATIADEGAAILAESAHATGIAVTQTGITVAAGAQLEFAGTVLGSTGGAMGQGTAASSNCNASPNDPGCFLPRGVLASSASTVAAALADPSALAAADSDRVGASAGAGMNAAAADICIQSQSWCEFAM